VIAGASAMPARSRCSQEYRRYVYHQWAVIKDGDTVDGRAARSGSAVQGRIDTAGAARVIGWPGEERVVWQIKPAQSRLTPTSCRRSALAPPPAVIQRHEPRGAVHTARWLGLSKRERLPLSAVSRARTSARAALALYSGRPGRRPAADPASRGKSGSAGRGTRPMLLTSCQKSPGSSAQGRRGRPDRPARRPAGR